MKVNTDAPHRKEVRFEKRQFFPSVCPKCQLENIRKKSKALRGDKIQRNIMMRALEM